MLISVLKEQPRPEAFNTRSALANYRHTRNQRMVHGNDLLRHSKSLRQEGGGFMEANCESQLIHGCRRKQRTAVIQVYVWANYQA